MTLTNPTVSARPWAAWMGGCGYWILATSIAWAICPSLSPAQTSGAADSIAPTMTDSDAIQERQPYLFEKHGGVVYRKDRTGSLKCDIYQPQGKGPFPAILAVHGGAWRSGSKVTMVRHARMLAGAGYVVIAINYRHAPEHPFPAQIHDCKYAVRWLKSKHAEYHIDINRVGAFGYSAGGHLVCLLGTTDANDGLEGPEHAELKSYDSRVQCVAAGGAPCEFSWIDEKSIALKAWIGNTRQANQAAYDKAAPLTYVTAGDPPFYFFHGEYDLVVPKETSLKFHEALTAVGVESEHEIALLSGHLSTFSSMSWLKRSLRFFDRHLKATTVPSANPSKSQDR